MSTNKKSNNISISQVFRTIIWPRRKLVFLGLFFIVISRLAGLVTPKATQYLIDDVLTKGDLAMLKVILMVVVGAVTIQAITSFLLTKILSVEAQHYISQLRVKVQKKVMFLPTKFFDNAKAGELVSRIMTDVEGVRNLVGTGLSQMIGGVLTALVSFTAAAYVSATGKSYRRMWDGDSDLPFHLILEKPFYALDIDASVDEAIRRQQNSQH